jgi:hypothetical protein
MEQMEDIRTQFSDVRKALEKTLEDRIHEISKQGEEQTSLLKPGDLPAQVEPKGTLIFWIVHAGNFRLTDYWDPVYEHFKKTEASSRAITLLCYGQEQDKVVEIFNSRTGTLRNLDTPATQAGSSVNWSRLREKVEELASEGEGAAASGHAAQLPRPWWLIIVAPANGLRWWQYQPGGEQGFTAAEVSSAGGTAAALATEEADYVKKIGECLKDIYVFLALSKNDQALDREKILRPEFQWKFIRALDEQTDYVRSQYLEAIQKVLDSIFYGWGETR